PALPLRQSRHESLPPAACRVRAAAALDGDADLTLPAFPRGRHRLLGRKADEARCAVGSNQQWLRACPLDSIAALQLRSVDSQVGMVDELVRASAVLRKARDTHGDRHPYGLACVLEVEEPARHGAPDPLRDRQRMIVARLRQENREFLAAEAGWDVVVAELLAEDLSHAGEHLVADQVPVRV